MELMFLIAGLFLFLAWIAGLLLNITSIRNLLTGGPNWKYKPKKPYLIRRKKTILNNG